jgi:hypothetical protein
MTSVPVGRRVGRYEILAEIGRGATALVHLARQTDLDREVALKELSALQAADPALVGRFLRESRLVGGLNHPNIVTVYEYFEHEGTPFIAMEYLPRGSLRPFVGSLDVSQIAGALQCVLAGLAHAETRGIVHRDLKPENLLVTSNGELKIADFGIAKALDAESGSLTLTGTTVGTPAYMAPEQAMAGEVGPSADLYATGVIAYELLAGTVPFQGSVAMAVMLQHLNDPVPPLRASRPDLDLELCDWVERMLAKQPERRPVGAADALDDLDEIVIRVLGPRWRRRARIVTGSMSNAPTSPPVVTPATRIAPPSETGPRRRRGVMLALGAGAAGLLLAGGVGAAFALTGDDGGSGATSTQSTQTHETTSGSVPIERPAGVRLSAVDLDTRADPARATLRLAGAARGTARVDLRDADISDGHAWFVLRGAGIDAKTQGAANDALTVKVRKARNMLRIDLRAEAGAFDTLVVRRGDHVVVARLGRPAPDNGSQSTTPTGGGSPPPETTTTSTTDTTPDFGTR